MFSERFDAAAIHRSVLIGVPWAQRNTVLCSGRAFRPKAVRACSLAQPVPLPPPPVTIGREPVTLQAQPVAAGRRAGRTGQRPSPVVGLADIRMVIHLVSQMDKRMDNLTAMHFDVFLCNFMWLKIADRLVEFTLQFDGGKR